MREIEPETGNSPGDCFPGDMSGSDEAGEAGPRHPRRCRKRPIATLQALDFLADSSAPSPPQPAVMTS
ncbi:hypothetical protein [Paracoccus mutanolyticus]|uniref:hypothetical protein n=1 Tax=Paracoccus mutanolyticus TaxID=1499308 RepID=UPI001676ED73|nr:hypothetical protein [Paracoccus mutanolyticus]